MLQNRKLTPGSIETHGLARSCFIKAEIESFAIEERKHVVQVRVLIGELHQRSHLHDKNMRLEGLIPLDKLGSLPGIQRRGAFDIAIQGDEPYHDV